MLVNTIVEVQASAEAGFTSPENVKHFAIYISFVLESLPIRFGDRFDFDAQLLNALAEECSQGGVRLSNMLIPKPTGSWGHQTIAMPSADGKSTHVIDVIHMPGEDEIDDIDMLDYGFVAHELGHNLLFKQAEPFCEAFTQVLDPLLNGLQRQTLSLQGSSKQIAIGTIDWIRKYWTPSANHFNWAHEIAVDVIALWICGPAYLSALQDVMEHSDLNPYKLGQSHPPYEVRAKSMIEAATQLHWPNYIGGFQDLIDQWPTTGWAKDKTNLYAACADVRLIHGSVSAALETCRSLALPLCTPFRIEKVQGKLRRHETLDLGTEIIIAAWLFRTQTDEAGYVAWERDAIRHHLSDITE